MNNRIDDGLVDKNWEAMNDQPAEDSSVCQECNPSQALRGKSQPKVSVIMPVYNVQAYLKDTLESLLKQTMPDFEVICIDDGSTDASADILTHYSRLDSRIRAVFANHQGAGEARNCGMELAAGEYLYFMDSDDMVVETMLERAYTRAKDVDADIVVFNALRLNDVTKELSKPLAHPREAWLEGKTVFAATDVYEHIFQIVTPAPWNKLFRRSYIQRKQLRFQNLPNTNDAFFTMTAMALADRITVLDEWLYHYRVGMTGNLQIKKDKAPGCVIDAYLAVHGKLVEEGVWESCEQSWVSAFLHSMCYQLQTLSSRQAYKVLYRRLVSPEVKALGVMDHEASYYQNPKNCDEIKKFLSGPIKYADADERDTRVLVAGSCAAPTVSVIIPVYNAEQHLPECLASIQNQTLRNIEIICVNDGSSDGSLDILCQAAKEDSRISVLVQNNSGLSAARNAGIQAARGKYLYYIDSDDMLKPDALQYLVETIEQNDLDYTLFSGDSLYESEELHTTHQGLEDYYHYRDSCKAPMSGPDLLTQLTRKKEYHAQACMQLVKTELIRDNGITFYDGIIHQDELYTLEVLLKARRCMTIPEGFYLRRVREGSIMTSTKCGAILHGYLACYTQSLSLVDQCELTVPQRQAVQSIQDRLMMGIKNRYHDLSKEELCWVNGLSTESQRGVLHMLEKLFKSEADLQKQKNELTKQKNEVIRQKNEVEKQKAAIKSMTDSLSWKLGRGVTWLPRKLKGYPPKS